MLWWYGIVVADEWNHFAYKIRKKKELQQRVVFQQHNSLIGGPTATSCPVCHKLCLGGEALMEHMKITHKDPNASGVASKYFEKTPSYIGLSNLLRHKLSAMYSLQKLYLLPNWTYRSNIESLSAVYMPFVKSRRL